MTSIQSSQLEQLEPRGKSLMDVHPQDDGTDDDNLASSILCENPKLATRSSSVAFNPVNNDALWIVRSVPGGEEELYAKGKCVYWTRNSLILKSFNFTENVDKIFWSKFDRSDHICITLTSGISIFNQLGQHFQVPLPFTHQNVYHTRLGLLIERTCDPHDDSTLPVLFALTQPTQEVSPVLLRIPTRSGAQCEVKSLSYNLPSYLSMVACHENLPLCLVYNSQDSNHSIWRIRSATPNEIDQFQQHINEESAATIFTNHNSTSFRDGMSQHSLNMSSKRRSSLMHQSNQSSTSTMNFSPKMDLRSKHSTLGNLAASRLGVGVLGATSGQTTEANSTNIKTSFTTTYTLNMMSTPNKNRIINYLRDNIEEPILPELTLEQIWCDSGFSQSSKANKFFTTTDLVGNKFIVIVASNSSQVRVMKFESQASALHSNVIDYTFGRLSCINAVDAMPIDEMNMMIVIDTSKNFVLYSGFDRITHVIVPSAAPTTGTFRVPPASSPAPMKGATLEMTPIQMSSARKRVSIGRSLDISINQMFQALSPVPHAHRNQDAKSSTPVSLGDIKRLEHVVGRSVIIVSKSCQRARFCIPSVCQTGYVRKLLDAMKALVSREFGLVIMSRWYQTRRSAGTQEMMKADDEVRLFKSWLLNCFGLSNNFFEETSLFNDVMMKPELSLKLINVSPTKKSRKTRDFESNPFFANMVAIFYSLHLVFEDLILIKLNYWVAADLAELLLVLACLLKLDSYQEYYWLKFPSLQQKFGPHKKQLESLIPKVSTLYKPKFFAHTPPSVMDFISKLILNSQTYLESCDTLNPYPNIVDVTENSFSIVSMFCEMFGLDRSNSIVNILGTLQVTNINNANVLTKQPVRSKQADQKLVELVVELGKTRSYLSCLPEGVNLYLWDAILNCREEPPTNWTEDCFELIGRTDLVSLVNGRAKLPKNKQPNKNGQGSGSSDEEEDEVLNLIFPDDIRVSESHRMLASDQPVEFSVTQRQGATEEESRDDLHRHLYLLNVRTMAMPTGRGAISLRTYSPIIGENFEMPRLELSGRALLEERPIEYTHDISVYPWPFFHNGVAAGLTICASSTNNVIDSTWINYNRARSNVPRIPDILDRDLTTVNMNNEHAGFLFALGLNGHLEKLSLMALHDYLCQNNDLTKLAILLGMSAAKRGTRDNNIIKVLSIHVDALLPPNSTELDVPAPVHAASIIGVGLLYQGSGDSHISKVLLSEIGRLPGPEANSHVDRESYSLSAGLAFGLVNLCKGGSTTISSSDQLRLYMLGGKRKLLTLTQRERYFKQDCHRGEEEYINTHITSPGGTLGLGLMYHRSGNQSVANWMRAPDTQTCLEYVRPDFLILRMLSYGLIMWNQIEPTEEWINSHIPKIVSTHAFQRNTSPASVVAAGLAASPVGSANGSGGSPTHPGSSIDFELMSQAYCNIVAGCCMAIAMRYAGTADKNAYKTIHKHTKMLIALNNKQALVEQAGRPCVETCLNVLVTSLAIVMAGTGDLGVMRVCRYLRSRLNHNCVFYGSYMAVHMALGILFLGACRYSLSTSPESVGALVCALFPIYPNHSSDNRYHLQALRHLYVLAVEPRLLIPRDIQTNRPVYATVTVRQSSDSGQIVECKLKAPCLMPEVDSIVSVYVDDDRFWRIDINDREALKRCLFRDGGFLCVKQKAHSSNNQLVQNIETYILQNMHEGVIKSRKSAALNEVVREDRVEQYAGLNELLTKTGSVKAEFICLTLEQLRLASSLAANDKRVSPMNKIHLLKPVVDQFDDSLARSGAHAAWCEYLARATDWTDTSAQVAQYVTLNDLKCDAGAEADPELLETLRLLDFST